MQIKKWVRAAGIRAIRTFAQAMIAYIGTGAIVIGDVNWVAALSAGLMGAVLSILMALAGLPEAQADPAIVPTIEPGWNEDRDDPEGKDE
jgi:hypothetical protein